MHLVFSSTDVNQLVNLSERMTKYIGKRNSCRSIQGFKRAFIQHLNRQYRKVPDNIGTLQMARNSYCSLCKEKKTSTQSIRTLRCGHVFHKRCIDNWLIDNTYRCYMCNKCQLT